MHADQRLFQKLGLRPEAAQDKMGPANLMLS
jgi:hypothetical protein